MCGVAFLVALVGACDQVTGPEFERVIERVSDARLDTTGLGYLADGHTIDLLPLLERAGAVRVDIRLDSVPVTVWAFALDRLAVDSASGTVLQQGRTLLLWRDGATPRELLQGPRPDIIRVDVPAAARVVTWLGRDDVAPLRQLPEPPPPPVDSAPPAFFGPFASVRAAQRRGATHWTAARGFADVVPASGASPCEFLKSDPRSGDARALRGAECRRRYYTTRLRAELWQLPTERVLRAGGPDPETWSGEGRLTVEGDFGDVPGLEVVHRVGRPSTSE